jgi:hypothetical protein
MYGQEHASFEFPGTTAKFCSGCSADFATIIVLTAEIDPAALDGVCVDELRSELFDISRRMLERSQSLGIEQRMTARGDCAAPAFLEQIRYAERVLEIRRSHTSLS